MKLFAPAILLFAFMVTVLAQDPSPSDAGATDNGPAVDSNGVPMDQTSTDFASTDISTASDTGAASVIATSSAVVSPVSSTPPLASSTTSASLSAPSVAPGTAACAAKCLANITSVAGCAPGANANSPDCRKSICSTGNALNSYINCMTASANANCTWNDVEENYWMAKMCPNGHAALVQSGATGRMSQVGGLLVSTAGIVALGVSAGIWL